MYYGVKDQKVTFECCLLATLSSSTCHEARRASLTRNKCF